jgi:hypothetical protein
MLFAKLLFLRKNICDLRRVDRSFAAENVVTTKFLYFVNIDEIFAKLLQSVAGTFTFEAPKTR